MAAILIVWPAPRIRQCPGRTRIARHLWRPVPKRRPRRAGSRLNNCAKGSVLKNVSGTFQAAGERIVFCPSDREAALPVLENLALERVWGMLESVGGRMWSVSGMVTEYRGRNYLLIDRAVVRSQAAKSAARP